MIRKKTTLAWMLLGVGALAVIFVLTGTGHATVGTSASNHSGISSMGHKGYSTPMVSGTFGGSSLATDRPSHYGACGRCLMAHSYDAKLIGLGSFNSGS